MDIQNIQQMQNKIMRIILYYRKDTEGEGGGERERDMSATIYAETK